MLYYVRTRTSLDDSQIWSCSLYDRESCRAVASKVNAFYLDVFSVGSWFENRFSLVWKSLVMKSCRHKLYKFSVIEFFFASTLEL